jgi:peptide/nickel transport system ATP-binding protein
MMTENSQTQPADGPLVSVRDLRVAFKSQDGTVNAVNGVDFDLDRGEVLCILGESGSGKSVTMRALMKLLPEKKTTITGNIMLDSHDIVALDDDAMSDLRGPTVSMIFQEPMTALNPVFSIGMQLREAVLHHSKCSKEEANARAAEMLELVGIPDGLSRLKNYPHQFSGGMRQRAMIAMALAMHPALLIADEPTTALDVTIQAQILELMLRKLQRELGMAVVFVTHDIGVAIEIADRIAVMYAGRFVETGPVREVFSNPAHPYTRGLMNSTVKGSMRGSRLQAIDGSPPDLSRMPPGCAFAPRCGVAEPVCVAQYPASRTVTPGHVAACIHAGKETVGGEEVSADQGLHEHETEGRGHRHWRDDLIHRPRRVRHSGLCDAWEDARCRRHGAGISVRLQNRRSGSGGVPAHPEHANGFCGVGGAAASDR